MEEKIKELDLTEDKCPVNYLKAKWELLQNPTTKLKLIFSDEKIARTVRASLEKDKFHISDVENVNGKFIFFVC